MYFDNTVYTMDPIQALMPLPSRNATRKRIYIPSAAYVISHLLPTLLRGRKTTIPTDAWILLRSRSRKLKCTTKCLSTCYWL